MNIQDSFFLFGLERGDHENLPLFYDALTCKKDADLPYIKIVECAIHGMEMPVERFFRPITKINHVNYNSHAST